MPSITVVPRFDLRRKSFGPRSVAGGNKKGNHHQRDGSLFLSTVELRGLEPRTPCMPCRCATSCATAPYFCFSGQIPRSNLTRVMHFSAGRQSAARRPETCLPASWKRAAENKKVRRNLYGSGGLTGGAEGTRTPDPLHAMQVRYQLRHSPIFLLPHAWLSKPSAPKQLKYLRTAFPKIPNRAYSVAEAS